MKHKLLNPLRLLMVAICMLGLAAEGQNVMVGPIKYQLDPSTKTAKVVHNGGAITQDSIEILEEILYEGETYIVNEIAEYSLTSNTFKYVTLPETITKIGEQAFMDDKQLESIIIPNSVTIIQQQAFANCTSLKSIKLSEGMTCIPGGLFSGCTSLESIEIPNSVNHFMEHFDTMGLEEDVIMQDAMTYCSDWTFYYIGGLTFWNCSNLKTVYLPKNLRNIPGYCFQGCTNLSEIEMPTNLEYIATSSFSLCPLKYLEFPASMTQWFNAPFDRYYTGAYFKSYHMNPAPRIDFYNTNLNATLCVPKGMTGIYSNISDWNRFARIIEATPVELTSEWRTFCAVEDLDFSEVEGLEAFIATEYQDGKVLMEPIEQVPAGTGVVLKGAPGFYEIPYPDQDEALEPVDNLLVGLNYGERIQAETEDGQCNLFFNDATEMASLYYGPGFDTERAPRLTAEGEQPMFAPADGARLPYHRAYLQ